MEDLNLESDPSREKVATPDRDGQTAKSSSESDSSSSSSEESFEYVVDPLFLGECRHGVCVPVYK